MGKCLKEKPTNPKYPENPPTSCLYDTYWHTTQHIQYRW